MSGRRAKAARRELHDSGALERAEQAQQALHSPLLHRELQQRMRGVDVSTREGVLAAAKAARILLEERKVDLTGLVVQAFFDGAGRGRSGRMRLRAVPKI